MQLQNMKMFFCLSFYVFTHNRLPLLGVKLKPGHVLVTC